jgi:hypothetical protein
MAAPTIHIIGNNWDSHWLMAARAMTSSVFRWMWYQIVHMTTDRWRHECFAWSLIYGMMGNDDSTVSTERRDRKTDRWQQIESRGQARDGPGPWDEAWWTKSREQQAQGVGPRGKHVGERPRCWSPWGDKPGWEEAWGGKPGMFPGDESHGSGVAPWGWKPGDGLHMRVESRMGKALRGGQSLCCMRFS